MSINCKRREKLVITIQHGEKELSLIKHNYKQLCGTIDHKNYTQELELVIVDDGKENLVKFFLI